MNGSENKFGIRTTYAGCNFRSRLEAKWARFFDLVGWKWEYEPCDFNGWIPDFVLIGATQITYAEVKPIPPIVELPTEVIKQIDNSGCDEEVIILGIGVSERDRFGWMREKYDDGWGWGRAAFGFWRIGNFGFCSEQGRYSDRISGTYDGGGWGRGDFSDVGGWLMKMLKQSGNEVQWNPQSDPRIARLMPPRQQFRVSD